MFPAALFPRSKTRNQLICPSRNGWVNKTHAMEYYSTLKIENSDMSYNINEILTHYFKWNKPATKGQIFYDSTY